MVRYSMLEVLDSEYIKLARVKGLGDRKVIWKHALRNASIAPITLFGLLIAQLVSSTVVIETGALLDSYGQRRHWRAPSTPGPDLLP